MENPFVTTDWLAAHLNDPNVVVLDGSWHMPNAARNAQAEYLAGHIPGAVFFDIDGIADTASPLPHMLPTPAEFAHLVGALGIADDMTIVIYDELGLFSAPRVWWTFKTMGARDVRILAGGGPKWRAERRPSEAGVVSRSARVFRPDFAANRVVDFASVVARSQDGGAQIADARPAPRFHAEVPEPRAGLRGGHIPNSQNVPVSLLTANGQMRTPEDLATLFGERGVALDRPIITSCGSGVTAATLALALELAGAKDVAVYDGSWTEYGARAEAEVET
ncbi:MAG TPA: 3-mercaptopyruvate sulfurtransferase [Devosia sp.]|nr:3-mercaptopyruvate sulfurtransferase [Devosia sp.]